MRFATLSKTLTAAYLLSQAAFASPLLDVESTSLSIDKSAEALDKGKIALSLTRIDDLIDDKNDYKLLLERVSHVALNIQLDVPDGSVAVNGQRLSLTNSQGHGAAVTIVNAEAYSLPSDMPAAFYEPEHIQSLVQSLSQGIVSVEVKLESESVPVDAIGTALDEDTVLVAKLEGASLRKVGLFVKINEIEGQTFSHSKTVYTPILQLLVTAQNTVDGEKITKIVTLSVDDQPVTPQSVHGSATDFLPDVLSMLPPLEAEKLDTSVERPHHEGHRPTLFGQQTPVSGFLGFLHALFGQPKFEADKVDAVEAGRPCRGMMRSRKGLALGRDAPSFRSGHSTEQDEVLASPVTNGTASDEDGNKGHHHLHGKHHRRPCFFRSFVHGFLSVFAGIGSVFAIVASSLPGAALLALLSGALLFKLTRKIAKRVRAKRSAQEERLPRYSEEETSAPFGEKFDGVLVEPPIYSARLPNGNLPLFDADADLDEKDEVRL